MFHIEALDTQSLGKTTTSQLEAGVLIFDLYVRQRFPGVSSLRELYQLQITFHKQVTGKVLGAIWVCFWG